MTVTPKIKTPRLYSVTGLKVVALLIIFYWHSPLPKEGMPDLGARCVELFFVASGFLVAYTHRGRFSERIDDDLSYVLRKVKKAYPAYILSVVLSVVWLLLVNGSEGLTSGYLSALPFHLILCQSWISGIAMLYNGAAWFLSAILVCYALAPTIDSALNRLSRRFGDRGGAIALLLASATIQLLVELGTRINPTLFSVPLYTFPPFRFLQFSMAYGAGALFLLFDFQTEDKSDSAEFLIASLIEIALSILSVYVIVRFDGTWMRSHYAILFVLVVYVIACGKGAVGRVLSLPIFKLMERIELEFYLLHQPVIRLVIALLALAGFFWVKKAAAIAFVATVLLSYLFVLAPRFTGHGSRRV